METLGDEYRDLVVCTSCQWAASLLRGAKGFDACPVCGSGNVEVIPVSDHESYTMKINEKGSIDIEFAR